MQESLFPNLFKVVSNYYFHHYTVQLQAEENCSINYFVGDMLRDSFLYACSEVKIMLGKKEITLYELLSHHHYQTAANYTKSGCKNKRKGYALDISTITQKTYKTNEVVSFGIVLIGKHNQQLPAVIKSLQLMTKKRIGKNKFSLQSFSETNLNGPDNLIYQTNKPIGGTIVKHPITLANFKTATAKKEWLQVNFITPTVFDDKGYLTGSYPFKTLLQKTISRIADTAFLFSGTSATQYKAAIPELEKYLQQTMMPVRVINLQWDELVLPGSKEKEALTLRGHTGIVVYTGKFNFYLDMLKLAEWLQIGDNTTYGFGKIKVLYE